MSSYHIKHVPHTSRSGWFGVVGPGVRAIFNYNERIGCDEAGAERQARAFVDAMEPDPLKGEADYMRGYNAAVSGVHEIHTHGDGISDVPEFVEDDARPICRVAFVDDPADPSAGLPHCRYWALTDDQSGTLLADLLRDYRPEEQ